MPTDQGWPTVDEEIALRNFAKARRTAEAVDAEPPSTDLLPMMVKMTLGDWKRLLDGDPAVRDRVSAMYTAHLDMANSLK